MKQAIAIMASALAMAAAVPAQAAYVLETNGGNGSVATNSDGFVLTGTDAALPAITTYTDVAAGPRTIRFNYTYTTFDVDGSDFDPAGYILNGALFQLSPQSLPSGGSALDEGGSVSGLGSFLVNTGDNFGFYVDSTDGGFGVGELSVTFTSVPEPSTWAMMILGIGLAGAALRRRGRRRQTVSYAF